MRNLESKFIRRKINYNDLIKFGFKKNKDNYVYTTKIANNQFEVQIYISNDKQYSKVIDVEENEEYTLVDVEDAEGKFVGQIRSEYENVIDEIINKCTEKEIFKQKQTKEIIEYITDKYNDELEFLWEKFESFGVWRNKQNNKWYGLIGIIKENKLKPNSERDVEILDLRYNKETIESIIDNKFIFPGYHMNKKSWITIILDGSVKTEEIMKLIDNSNSLSIGNKCGFTGDNLSQRVYDYLTTIPKGKVVTYKQVAEYLGNKGFARAVGNILHKNPDGDKYPCYKVLNSKGELAEAFVFGGKNVQKKRLEKEDIKVLNNKVDLKMYQWKQ